MFDQLATFLLHWGITALSLWIASRMFSGVRFADLPSLLIAALLLGFANAFVKPLLVVLTLPLTLVTLGFFLLVINALMLQLVAALVHGFTVAGFWTAFFASIVVATVGFFTELLIARESIPMMPAGGGIWM